MNVFVFAPHPDDDVIGCGGSIIKLRQSGHDVHVVYLTSGESGSRTIPKSELARMREQEAHEALGAMDVHQSTFLRLPDGFITYSSEILKTLVKMIRDYKPDRVYLPHKNDGHGDHKNTHIIVMEAIGRARGNAFQEYEGSPWDVGSILAYEVWTPLERITYVEDISGVIGKKIEALRKHKTQLANVAYDEAARGLNRYRGAMLEKGTYAECFDVLRISSLA